jgi:hypothetical protein
MHTFFPNNYEPQTPFDHIAVNNFVLNMEVRVRDSKFVTLVSGYMCGRYVPGTSVTTAVRTGGHVVAYCLKVLLLV